MGRPATLAELRASRRDIRLPTLILFNLLYWPYLLTTNVVLFFPAFFIFLVTLPFDPRRRLLHRFTSHWGAHYLAWAPFAGVTVTGREKINHERAYVYASNHQSMVDILAAFAVHLPYLWVSKLENFYVPFLGWAMVLNRYVPLRRGHLPSVMRMVRLCYRRLGEGHSLFIFPEGTRSADGLLLPFFSGAFRIAVKKRVPLVPIAIDGTGEILPKGSHYIQPRHVSVSILDPIDPASVGYDWKKLRDLTRERMAAELERLRGANERSARARAA
jgi:1-acyl-sn-glycerol-3-phosphate acyltransferase